MSLSASLFVRLFVTAVTLALTFQLSSAMGVVKAMESDPVVATLEGKSQGVVCPERTLSCPDGNTCCLMPNHQWVCCPLPYAVCCFDGYHCCPRGSRCTSALQCVRADGTEYGSELTFIKSILAQPADKKQIL